MAQRSTTVGILHPWLLRRPVRALACACGLAIAGIAGAADAGLDEIIVTAQKRSQDSRNVDISLTVVPANVIAGLRLTTLPEAAALAENVEIFEDYPGAGIPTWIIRGVGLQDFNSNNTPTAGVWLDESYQVATVMGGAALFDVDQVEVLKGPQGGLYGRNTSGGAVRLNTRRADPGSREGWLSFGYGSWQQARMQAGVNAPLNATTVLRVAAYGEKGTDGWQRQLGTGVAHGDAERWDLRSWLRFDPSDVVSVEWKLQGGSDESDIQLGRSIGLYANSGVPAICTAVLSGRRDDASCINFGGVNRLRRNRGEVPESIAAQDADGSAVFSDTLGAQNNAYISSVLDVAVELQNMQLRSITSFDDFGYGVALDLDGSRGEYGHRISDSDIRVLSQELRLLSASVSPLQWLAGVAFSSEDFEENRQFNLRDNTLVPLYRGILAYDQETRATSLYADLKRDINAIWSVGATLRYTDEEKEYRDGNFYIPLASPVYLARNLASDYELGDNLSGSVSVDWEPDALLLGYAKISRGFKSGGFYGGFPFSAIEVAPYSEETITAYELGFKKSFPASALQLNGALFHYDYQDVQGFVQTINPLTNTGIDKLANQGDADHDGAELQLQWRPLEQLDVAIGLAWLDARFVSTGTTTTNLLKQQVPIQGRRPYAPEWSGNALVNLRQRAWEGIELNWYLAWDYRSNFAGAQSVPAEMALNQLPGYGVVNGGIELGMNGAPWRARLWLHNLLDKTYRTRVKSDGLSSYIEMFGEPRAFGVDFELRL